MKEQIKSKSQKSIYLFIVMNCFFMKDNETIVEMITRFTNMVNGLEAFDYYSKSAISYLVINSFKHF